MSKAVKYTKKSNKNTIACIVGVSFFVILIIVAAIADNVPRNSYLKTLKTARTVIMEKSYENNKCYIRINPVATDYYFSLDDSWFEVSSSFYNIHNLYDEIGALIGNYDVYKRKFFGKGQSFEKNTNYIEEVYNDYNSAIAANPEKNYVENTVLYKKRITKSGNSYFVLKADETEYVYEVDRKTYDSFALNSEIPCSFQSIGDFKKLVKIGG